jgi:hypothetical protein
MKNKILNRREFLKDSAASTMVGALYWHLPQKIFSNQKKNARVVLIREKNLFEDAGKQRHETISRMLDEAVQKLLNESDPKKAWRQIIKPDDTVGIKSNVWSYLPTPPELEEAIKKRVIEAGVPENNISISDRGILYDKIFLKSTALINVRPMRTHHWSGLGTLLKNYIMFVKKPDEYHGDTCADLATIWKLPLVKGKTRLNILVMFTPLFHSVGPHNFNSKYTWTYNGLLVGVDPVAVDATGARIIMAKRKEFFKENRPLTPPPKHIYLADTRHHLGTADPEKIELIKLGWQENLLI